MSRSTVEEQAGGDRSRWGERELTSCIRGWCPGRRASRAAQCAPSPSRRCRSAAGGGVLGRGGDGATTKGRNPSRRR
jgi:hypothetical protein